MLPSSNTYAIASKSIAPATYIPLVNTMERDCVRILTETIHENLLKYITSAEF